MAKFRVFDGSTVSWNYPKIINSKREAMTRILFVTSEAHPLIKTGGLADVSGSLPKSLAELSQDVRILLPRYHDIQIPEGSSPLCRLMVDNCPVNLYETHLDASGIIAWLVDCPQYFGAPGNPYVDEQGQPWANIAERFALFCRIAVEVAMNRAHLNWQPEIVHCNDWQSGLIPAFLSQEQHRPTTVFTIHNLAYQGTFPKSTFKSLNIPNYFWNPNGLEYHKSLSFIKGGLAYADQITTVSPTYAQEIQTPEFGYGLEGLLNYRQDSLCGIVNGIDYQQWCPEQDIHISEHYNADNLLKKTVNKLALQQRLGLPVDKKIPLLGLIGRLVDQKGIDLIIDNLEALMKMNIQFVLLGSGVKKYEQALYRLAQKYPEKTAFTLGYDEPLAHQIEAGADIFLMPSKFEPCGLNQMYSQRYGTIPIVRRTGGLADTVTDTIPETIADKTATGIVFDQAESGALLEAIKRSLILYSNKRIWKQMQTSAMNRDFSWEVSANQYLHLYQRLLGNRT